MTDGLYHSDLGLPDKLLEPWLRHWRLAYSRHAGQQLLSDPYGTLKEVPTQLFLERDRVFEVGVESGAVNKVAVRLPDGFKVVEGGENLLDLSLVLAQSRHAPGSCLFVVTLWLNQKDDVHRTLDRSKYQRI